MVNHQRKKNKEELQARKCPGIVSRKKKGKRKVQEVPQSQTAVLPRHQEEEEINKTKQAQIEQMRRLSMSHFIRIYARHTSVWTYGVCKNLVELPVAPKG